MKNKDGGRGRGGLIERRGGLLTFLLRKGGAYLRGGDLIENLRQAIFRRKRKPKIFGFENATEERNQKKSQFRKT